MLYLFNLLFLLIKIDQETVLNWFGIKNSNNQNPFSQIESSTNVSKDTFQLIIEGLWGKIQEGLTLGDIETILVFILFIRFVILAIRYNLKTSLYITCIGLFAGVLWYMHLTNLITMYRTVLLKLPLVHALGEEIIQSYSLQYQQALTDLRLGTDIHWYNPGKLIYYAFIRGIISVDPETGLRHYMDPMSMIVSNLKEPTKSNILPIYYKFYNSIIPKIFDICSKFWMQLSGVAAYAVITRIGKRYCPYLIRWHWTFLLIIGMVESIFTTFVYRVYYFQTFVLIPKTKELYPYVDQNLALQIKALNGIVAFVVLAHIGLVLFGLFHAIWGQYFYFPFFVENTELHIGPRPKNSIYSGGNTAWQEPNEKENNSGRLLPKFWYGWFGSGTKNSWQVNILLKKWGANIFKKIRKQLWK